MKQDHLKQMYGSTPESFRHRIAFALKETEAKTMKRKFIARTVFIVCAILVLMTAVACAAFPSQVTAFFGRLYGNGMQAWLEKGDMAAVNKSFVLDEVEFIPYTEKTKTSKEALIQELEKIRKSGYALDDEELSIGVCCIAAPIYNHKGEVKNSIGISGPSARIRKENIDSYINKLKIAASNISHNMGYRVQK
jgi:hypothetical protein